MFPQPSDVPDWKSPPAWSNNDAALWDYCQQDVMFTQSMAKRKKPRPEPSVYEQLADIEPEE